MDTFWLTFLVVIFKSSVGTAIGFAEEQCYHPCVRADRCNFIFTQNRCYYVYTDELRSWEESKQHCEAQGLQMMKIDNNANLTTVVVTDLLCDLPDRIRTPKRPAWLGGKARDFGSWKFLGGTPVSYENLDLWTSASIDIDWQDREQCGCFSPYAAASYPHDRFFSISLQRCHRRQHFICRKHTCETPAIQNCLVFREERKGWFEARSLCIDMGGDLFYLKEGERLSQFGLGGSSPLYDAIRYSSFNVHIGMVHREWIWHDGITIYNVNWLYGEPYRYDRGCLMMYGETGKCYAGYCIVEMLTLCQGDIITTIIPSTPSATQQSYTKTIHGLTAPTAAEADHQTAIPTSSTTAGQNVIILGSLLGLAVLIILALCFWKQRKKLVPKMENNVHTASSHDNPENQDIPENQSPSTDAYVYINSDEIPEKRPEITVRYQNVNDNEVPVQYLNPPLNWP